jgi:16S rRNA A1518/A1519 N6-dimethyltransferase RsmA/KsgA/DIM1 with predicted DNA glycosylase/AP lyase activity
MKLDQHFLTNEELAKEIVSYLEIKPNESILEIGPGKGILSKYLKKATLVELDKDLAKELNKLKKHKVINKNVLRLKLKYDKIIGNIPYSISEPLINKLIKSKFKLAILTVPEKFLTKGLLNLIIPHLLEIKTLKTINKDQFSPKPRVNSKVIQIKKKQLNNQEKLIKKIYIQSDKKLKNIISTNLEFKNKKIRELNINQWKVLINGIKRT